MSAKKPSQAATRAADRILKETVVSLVCKEERDCIAAIIDEEIAEIRRPKYCKCGTKIFGETTMCWNCVNEYAVKRPKKENHEHNTKQQPKPTKRTILRSGTPQKRNIARQRAEFPL